MISRLAIYLLLTGCLVFGAIVFLELLPAATDEQGRSELPRRPDMPPAPRRQQSARLEELLATVLGRPLFSSSRRPPQTAADNSGGTSDLADTRLTGIVTEPGRSIAIFAVNGAKPLKLTEGEAVSGWRIESITPREVALSGPGGAKTLAPKIDPNLGATPPGPAPAAAAAVRPPVPPSPAAAPPARPGVPPGRGRPPPQPARIDRQP
ncbi:MAG TPA: hypothetical protein VN849_06735 [Stellaceae bacterium]|nr:hypothetical protein [Stellaceae bacterium]